MARFKATTTFLHDRDRFEEGEEYVASDGLAHYFVVNGWATSDDIAEAAGPAPQDVTLDIVDGEHAHGADHVDGEG